MLFYSYFLSKPALHPFIGSPAAAPPPPYGGSGPLTAPSSFGFAEIFRRRVLAAAAQPAIRRSRLWLIPPEGGMPRSGRGDSVKRAVGGFRSKIKTDHTPAPAGGSKRGPMEPAAQQKKEQSGHRAPPGRARRPGASTPKCCLRQKKARRSRGSRPNMQADCDPRHIFGQRQPGAALRFLQAPAAARRKNRLSARGQCPPPQAAR